MKKTFLIPLIAIFTFSCTKKEEIVDKTTPLKIENEVIAKNFGISSLQENQKIPNVVSFRNNASLSENGYKIILDKSKTVYAIPYKNKDNSFLITDGSGKELTLDLNIDKKGNGDVIITTEEEKIIKNFENAKLVQLKSFEINDISFSAKGIVIPKQKVVKGFKECMEQSYEDVCDGFIGCLAWYTHPAIPIVAAAICEFKD
jgi:lipoprotein